MYTIIQKDCLASGIFRIKIAAPVVAKKAKPGQFIIYRLDEYSERIPLTISDSDMNTGTITIIVQAIGASTMRLTALNAGDALLDVVGPLGKATNFGGMTHVAVIGGGVGTAIAYPQAKALYKSGAYVHIVAGFKNKSFVILEEELKRSSNMLTIATDDGSYGQKGFVTDILLGLTKSEQFDTVIAIGPLPMMKAVSALTKPLGIRTIVSLNPIMIDGTGMCGGCRVNVAGQVKFACVDGPDFDGHEVDFDGLIARNSLYRNREAHVCRLLNQVEE